MNLQEKAKEVAKKAKLAADEMKQDATGADGKVSVNSIKTVNNKTKAIGGSILVALILIMMIFSGGARSVNASSLGKVFPTNGSLSERCEAFVYLEYDYWTLIGDKEPIENMTAALKSVLEKAKMKDKSKMGAVERQYYKALAGMKYTIKKQHTMKPKPSKINLEQYEKRVEFCIKEDAAMNQ